MLISLINGGAIIDFRSKVDGSTSMHKAVVKNSIEGLQTLLDLGASPNYKDLKGLSPLYYCVTNSSDVVCCELLLHDRSSVGATDLQGKIKINEEIHSKNLVGVQSTKDFGEWSGAAKCPQSEPFPKRNKSSPF